MNKLYLQIDDVTPESVERSENVLVKLKEHFPKFKATLFVVPKKCSLEWLKQFKEKHNYVQLAVHGENHEFSECTDWNSAHTIKVLNKANETGCFVKIFKAPRWNYNVEVYEALKQSGWKVIVGPNQQPAVPEGLINFTFNWKINQELPPENLDIFALSHMSPESDNDINKCLENLMKFSPDTDFGFYDDLNKNEKTNIIPEINAIKGEDKGIDTAGMIKKDKAKVDTKTIKADKKFFDSYFNTNKDPFKIGDGKHPFFNFLKGMIPKSVKNILEIGCNIGGFTSNLSKQGYEVKAIDISEKAIKLAKKKFKSKKIKFYCEDIFNIKENKILKKSKFDCIICSDVIYYYNEEKRKEMLEIICEHLNMGGFLIVSWLLEEGHFYSLDGIEKDVFEYFDIMIELDYKTTIKILPHKADSKIVLCRKKIQGKEIE